MITRTNRLLLFPVSNGRFTALYEALISEGKIRRDPRQETVVALLQKLGDNLESGTPPSPQRVTTGTTESSFVWKNFSFWSRPSSQATTPPKSATGDSPGGPTYGQGLYLFGGCGTGKTMLMDLFFANLSIARKRRVHFHEYMIDVHKRLHALQKGDANRTAAEKQQGNVTFSRSTDLCEQVANELISEANFLCFDEFQVTFISDAVIMRRLFSFLFEKGVVVLATSNRPPEDLYLNGLNRELFVPFIPVLKTQCFVHNMDSATDYRQLTSATQSWNKVLFDMSTEKDGLESKFFRLANNEIDFNTVSIEVQGRSVAIRRAAKKSSIAWFTFKELCDKPLGSADYITIGKKYHTIFIELIPRLTLQERDQVRRFITLIDALYDHNVRLICALEPKDVKEIFFVDEETKKSSSMDEVFAWDRTVSRLIEMFSEEYQIRHIRSLSATEFFGQFNLDQERGEDELREIFVRYDKNNDSVIAVTGLNRMISDIQSVVSGGVSHVTASPRVIENLTGSPSGTRVHFKTFKEFVNNEGSLLALFKDAVI